MNQGPFQGISSCHILLTEKCRISFVFPMRVKILFFFSSIFFSHLLGGNWTPSLTADEIFSQAQLGSAYHEGLAGIYLRSGEKGQVIDLNASRIWSQKAIDQDHPFGFYNMANLAVLEGDFEQANQHYSYAAPLLQPLASEDDAVALYCLGEINMLVVPTNMSRAIDFFKRSAELRYPLAQATLGALYLSGLPGLLDRNSTLGIQLLFDAKESDSLLAKFNLGLAYCNGDGVSQNYEKGAEFLELAERQNFSEAQYTLGLMLIKGDGIEKNIGEGMILLKKASNQGHKLATEYLSENINWNDFKYNSQQEKIFWDQIPIWSIDQNTSIYKNRWAIHGRKLINSQDLGYTGYAKLQNQKVRHIYRFKNGWATQGKSWNLSGNPITSAEYKMGFLDGAYSEWYDNGQKKFEGNFIRGLAAGKQVGWHANGKKGSEAFFTIENNNSLGTVVKWNEQGIKVFQKDLYGGKLHGKEIVWYENGNIKSEANFKDDVQEGIAIFWHENGQKKSEQILKKGILDGLAVFWHKSGWKMVENSYRSGKKDGICYNWYDNGQKKSEVNFKDGNRDGAFSEWYDNGQKKSEMNFKDGKLDGLALSWHENGQKEVEAKYSSGIPISNSIVWYANGIKKSILPIKNGLPSGRALRWYSNGQMSGEVFIDNGLYVSGKVWKPNGEPCPITNLENGNGISVRYNEEGEKIETLKYNNGRQFLNDGTKSGHLTDGDGNRITPSSAEKAGMVFPKKLLQPITAPASLPPHHSPSPNPLP